LKLVYIAHGWMLGLYGRPLIRDRVEAWRYGPVIPRLYDAVRAYRGEPVTELLAVPLDQSPLSAIDEDVIKQVSEIYSAFGGLQLSALTHREGSPWELTYDGRFGAVISNDLIRDHYERLAETHAETRALV
jgi:uncharacterized phage-associated protein